MEVDLGGISRAAMSVLSAPAVDLNSAGKSEPERPRSSSTPCSPIKRTVSGYQILHMDTNFLVGFATGEELLKLAQRWSGSEGSVAEALPSQHPKQREVGLTRSSRVYRTKNQYYQPYEIPAANGRRRRRMPSSGERTVKSLSFEPSRCLRGPLPLCLIKGKRAQSKSLDYLNLDKMNIKEPADTEVLQYQLQHLTLRGERVFSRNKT
ncbi:macrophage immunometabolism regulator [Callorhinchus milii]|uniref:Macrophage immunometabolism regulator n=1 Tax=Callorhinchus milii TaxID=7868 RepID=A0A4W3JL08_CALMI|nr:macrophage immunometabolism regulator [Callorhinchus milii]XP_007891323.1 macrophage immunometabolism regulator [Callorhinchus milii]XP_042194772.1 macrophage immunometabolism regulator [Callorhinchus milii]|eukprot:gi/632951489/ref/XP_007891322.1/ PREDICTED: UNC119-binding protein C5orf30 homolog [Callorhinchus milii]